MDHERLDLSPLDPAADRLRWERLIRRINAAAGAELRRRAEAAGPLAFLAGWARPLLSGAALVAVASGSVLSMVRSGTGADSPVGSMADALWIPEPVAEWVADERQPSVADLLLAYEGELP